MDLLTIGAIAGGILYLANRKKADKNGTDGKKDEGNGTDGKKDEGKKDEEKKDEEKKDEEKKDEEKKDEKKDELPPVGAITAEERAAVDLVVAQLLVQLDPSIVPPPDNVRPANTPDDVWFGRAGYWMVYRTPTGDWVQDGNSAAPIYPAATSPWRPVLDRIQAYAGGKVTPKDSGADVPNDGPITTGERLAADATIAIRPTSVQGGVVPPAYANRKPGESDLDWFTKYTYWALYVSPTADWVKSGHTAAPVKIPSITSPWVPIYKRIEAYVEGKLKPNAPAKPTIPVGPITTAEKTVADSVAFLRPSKVEDGTVPPANATKRADESWLDWLTKYTYWAVYRNTNGAWVQSGGEVAPIKIPSQTSPWVPVYNRIQAYLRDVKKVV